MTRPPTSPPLRGARSAIATLAIALVAGAFVAPTLSDAQSEGGLGSQAERARAREQGLAADVARLGRLVTRLERDLAIVERRRAEVQAQLDADRLKLAGIQADLRAQRERVVRLRARLHEARIVLAGRMRELYETPQPDLVTVVLRARGF